MANKAIYLTEEGLKELTNELEYLKTEKRPEVIQSLKEARALGDLSENAEQAQVEGRIKELEVMIDNVEIISGENNGRVVIGSTVKLSYIDDYETEEYKIVGSQESDPFNNKISNESPLAIAVLNHKENEIVTVDSPKGKYDVKILKIS